MLQASVERKCFHDLPQDATVRRGLYVYQLELWLSLFPKEQVRKIQMHFA